MLYCMSTADINVSVICAHTLWFDKISQKSVFKNLAYILKRTFFHLCHGRQKDCLHILWNYWYCLPLFFWIFSLKNILSESPDSVYWSWSILSYCHLFPSLRQKHQYFSYLLHLWWGLFFVQLCHQGSLYHIRLLLYQW